MMNEGCEAMKYRMYIDEVGNSDLIAHPSFRAFQARRSNQALPDNFGGQIAQILENEKLHRSPQGKIEGWGRKWLP